MFTDMETPSLESGAWSAGAGFVDSVRATGNAITEGDWGDLAASGGVMALDALLGVVDPVGSALAAGVGWLMEHFEPLRELLDFVAGDPEAIKGGADTWLAIKEELQELATEFPEKVEQQTESWSGAAKDAYSRQVEEYVEGLEALSASAGNASSAIATSGTMVATCRGLIRDIIASVVAELIKGALAALAGSVVSFGATVAGYLAYAAGRIGATIAKITAKIGDLLAKLGKAGALLARTLDDMAEVSAKVGANLTTGGARAFPTSPAMGGAATAAGRGSSVAADGMNSAASGATRASEGATELGGRTADAASSLGRGADNLSGTGARLIHGADDAGQVVADGVGKRAQDAVQGAGYGGKHADAMDAASNILKPDGMAMRGGLGAGQYHEQNYDSDDNPEADSGSYHESSGKSGEPGGGQGSGGWSGTIPT